MVGLLGVFTFCSKTNHKFNGKMQIKAKQRKMVFKEVKQWRDQKRPTLFVMRNGFWNILLFVEMLVEDDAI